MVLIPIGVGSNGGNSFEIAKLLERDLDSLFYNSGSFHHTKNSSKRNKIFTVEICDMDSIRVEELLHIEIIIFICSTTGDGDAPYNMQRFWKELKRKSWNGAFSFDFALVSLGDSNYPKYNYAAKRLFNRLVQVGGVPLCSRCDCDEMDPMGVYSAYIPWITELKKSVLIKKYEESEKNKYSLFINRDIGKVGVYIDKKQVAPLSLDECIEQEKKLGGTGNIYRSDGTDLSSFGSMYSSVHEYRFMIETEGYEYSIGDVLSIDPQNIDYEKVSSLIFFDDDTYLSKHLDYSSIPMFHHIKELYEMAKTGNNAVITPPNNLQRIYLERLLEIATSYDLYYSYVLQPKKSFKEILVDFYIKISAKSTLIRRIRPRYYTISKRDGNLYSITAGRIKMKHYTKEILGVCSEYLFHLEERSLVSIDIQKTQLTVEGDLLVVCTGTGISLGRTILNEYLAGRVDSVKSVSIIFGFRSLFLDCLHFSEFLSLHNSNIQLVQKNGYVYVSNETEEKRAKIFLIPSRIKSCPELLLKHNILAKDVQVKNYVENILEIIDLEELQKNIIICGGVRLLKSIPKILQKRNSAGKKPQSECW